MLIQLYIVKGPLNMLFWNKHIQILACYFAKFIQIQNMQEHYSLHDQWFPKNIYHYQFD